MLIKTGIAPVFSKYPHYLPENSLDPQWMEPVRNPKDKTETPDPNFKEPEREATLCWFDEMLGQHIDEKEAGLHIPTIIEGGDNRPFLMIVSGPPGSAKSTFALQICYNFARRKEKREDPSRPAALYITTETSGRQIFAKGIEFGWEEDVFQEIGLLNNADYRRKPPSRRDQASTCYVYGVPNGPPAVIGGNDPFSLMNALRDHHNGQHPEILVIDSLNTLPDFRADQEDQAVSQLIDFSYNKNAMRRRLLIVVLDVESSDNQMTKRFGFFADATIRIDMTTDAVAGILHRTIEITKIKSQKHAEGKHAIAIFPKPTNRDKSPFLREGGLFVYPSIPWYTEHVREFYAGNGDAGSSASPKPLPIQPARAGMIVSPKGASDKGFTPGHTISFEGQHDTLKSLFAYTSLLRNVIKDGKSGLIVSLRGDRSVIAETLAGIVKTEFSDYLKDNTEALKKANPNVGTSVDELAIVYVNQLFHDDKLAFVHYEPGYLSAGEFFHRIYAAYNRPRLKRKRVAFVVVDGLDQLDTKFPLCATEKLFVSALVTLFKADKQACAVFLSSQDSTLGPAATVSALIPDLLLRFVEPPDLKEKMKQISGIQKLLHGETAEECHQAVEVQAVRIPFGEISESSGHLWRTVRGNLRFIVLGPQDPDNEGQAGLDSPRGWAE